MLFVCAAVLLAAALCVVGYREAKTEYVLERTRDVVNVALQFWYTVIDPLVQRIQEARRGPTRGPDDRVILVPRAAGPVVVSPDCKYPVPLSRVPIRSTKARAKKMALAYARELTGNPELTWKAGRKLLTRLEREGRAIAAADQAPALERDLHNTFSALAHD